MGFKKSKCQRWRQRWKGRKRKRRENEKVRFPSMRTLTSCWTAFRSTFPTKGTVPLLTSMVLELSRALHHQGQR